MEAQALTEAERVELLIRRLENGVAARFAEKTGIPTPKLSRLRGGELRLAKNIDAILRAYPMVNREWLETGVGYPGDLTIEMVKLKYIEILNQKDKLILSLIKELDMQRRIIDKKLSD